MNFQDRQLLTSRILFGAVRCQLDEMTYYLSSPSQFHIFVGNELYADLIEQCKNLHIFSEQEMVDYLCSIGLWSPQEQEELDGYNKTLENLKLELFEYIYRINDFMLCKLRIKKAKQRYMDLLNKRHNYDYLTAEGLATFQKMNYLIGAGLKDSKYKPLWEDTEFLQDRTGILDSVRHIYQNTRISESMLRELARTEPWRMYWSVCDKSNIFGRSPLELTEEQKSLVAWTKLYDSVYESIDCPDDKVITDDDLLDAWLILQRRKRNEDKTEKRREETKLSKNDKINSAQQVFVMVGDDIDPITGKKIQLVQNLEEAQELDKIINNDVARAAKQARFKAIQEGGELIKHVNLSDVRQDINIQYNNQVINARKQKGF